LSIVTEIRAVRISGFSPKRSVNGKGFASIVKVDQWRKPWMIM